MTEKFGNIVTSCIDMSVDTILTFIFSSSSASAIASHARTARRLPPSFSTKPGFLPDYRRCLSASGTVIVGEDRRDVSCVGLRASVPDAQPPRRVERMPRFAASVAGTGREWGGKEREVGTGECDEYSLRQKRWLTFLSPRGAHSNSARTTDVEADMRPAVDAGIYAPGGARRAMPRSDSHSSAAVGESGILRASAVAAGREGKTLSVAHPALQSSAEHASRASTAWVESPSDLSTQAHISDGDASAAWRVGGPPDVVPAYPSDSIESSPVQLSLAAGLAASEHSLQRPDRELGKGSSLTLAIASSDSTLSDSWSAPPSPPSSVDQSDAESVGEVALKTSACPPLSVGGESSVSLLGALNLPCSKEPVVSVPPAPAVDKAPSAQAVQVVPNCFGMSGRVRLLLVEAVVDAVCANGTVGVDSCGFVPEIKREDVASCLIEADQWVPVLALGSAGELEAVFTVLLSNSDLDKNPPLTQLVDHVRKVGAYADRFLESLRHCESGLVSQKLDVKNFEPLFSFVVSKCGMSCFATFVRQWQQLSSLSSGSRGGCHSMVEDGSMRLSLEMFCGIWLDIDRIYKFCHRDSSSAPCMMASCGGGLSWSPKKKLGMCIFLRDEVPSLTAQLEPVQQVMSRIVGVGIERLQTFLSGRPCSDFLKRDAMLAKAPLLSNSSLSDGLLSERATRRATGSKSEVSSCTGGKLSGEVVIVEDRRGGGLKLGRSRNRVRASRVEVVMKRKMAEVSASSKLVASTGPQQRSLTGPPRPTVLIQVPTQNWGTEKSTYHVGGNLLPLRSILKSPAQSRSFVGWRPSVGGRGNRKSGQKTRRVSFCIAENGS